MHHPDHSGTTLEPKHVRAVVPLAIHRNLDVRRILHHARSPSS
jgi:hypothetical protein